MRIVRVGNEKDIIDADNTFMDPEDGLESTLLVDKMYEGQTISIDHGEIAFIRASFGRSCAVTKDSSVYIWGEGFTLQNPEEPEMIFKGNGRIIDLRFGKKHGLYLNDKGHVFSWGEGTYGELGLPKEELQ